MAQAVVDQERQAEPVGLLEGEVERGVVVRPMGGLDPVEDQLAAGAGPGLPGGMDSQVGDHRGIGCRWIRTPYRGYS